MNLKTALQLGRISNLPTVWSNVLVGALLVLSRVFPEIGGAMKSVVIVFAAATGWGAGRWGSRLPAEREE